MNHYYFQWKWLQSTSRKNFCNGEKILPVSVTPHFASLCPVVSHLALLWRSFSIAVTPHFASLWPVTPHFASLWPVTPHLAPLWCLILRRCDASFCVTVTCDASFSIAVMSYFASLWRLILRHSRHVNKVFLGKRAGLFLLWLIGSKIRNDGHCCSHCCCCHCCHCCCHCCCCHCQILRASRRPWEKIKIFFSHSFFRLLQLFFLPVCVYLNLKSDIPCLENSSGALWKMARKRCGPRKGINHCVF